MFLSGLGGALGILIGFGLARILPVVVTSLPTPVISTPSVFLAFGISGGIGLFFGLYPANRATWLRPIEAFRYARSPRRSCNDQATDRRARRPRRRTRRSLWRPHS